VKVEATTDAPLATDADTIVVALIESEGVAHDVADRTLGSLLGSGEARTDFKSLAVTHAEGRRFVLVGVGKRQDLDAERLRRAAAVAHGRARELGARTMCWEVPHDVGDDAVRAVVEGTLLHAYRFDHYKHEPQERSVERLIISAHQDVGETVNDAAVIAAAQKRARDLANTPANDLTPQLLADYASRVEGATVTVMDGKQITEAGMGAFAAVAQGTDEDPRLIVLRYDGSEADGSLLGLVGKAVTFDSGGLSLKQAASMEEMKFDMSGGAAVIEAVAALAALRAPVNVIGVVGATENLPSGSAVKPGDIVRTLDGTTVEINNTDAEGRLVLADCLTYARQQGCDHLVDVATLTGAVVIALGSVHAGLMSNDDGWAGLVEQCAQRSGELVWRLPLHADYAEMAKGRYAVLTNKPEPREALSITAAEFLHHFVGGTPWAHLDIAGTAYDVRRPYFADKGATGFGVRLLVELARSV
jgi:leucyl aminopeptidase